MTPYDTLKRAEEEGRATIEIREKSTGKTVVANTCGDAVMVFYGADDGSDDKTIGAAEFSRDFEITAII